MFGTLGFGKSEGDIFVFCSAFICYRKIFTEAITFLARAPYVLYLSSLFSGAEAEGNRL